MSNLVQKFSNLFGPGAEVITNNCSQKTTQVLVKAASSLALSAFLLHPSFVQSAESNSGIIEQLSAQQQSSLLRDHVSYTNKQLGFAFDSGSDELNYRHPTMSKVNDFLMIASKDLNKHQMQELNSIVVNANKFMDTKFYKMMDTHSKVLADLVSDKFVEIYPLHALQDMSETELSEYKHNHHDFKRIINAMNDNEPFPWDNQVVDVDNKSGLNHLIDIIHANPKGISIAGMYTSDQKSHHLTTSDERFDDGSTPLVLGYHSFYLDDDYILDDTKSVLKSITNIVIKAYGLTQKDISLKSSHPLNHEIGHSVEVDTLPKSEFIAELTSLWADVQNGGSKQYLQLRLDHHTAIFGYDYRTSQHNTIGLISAYLGKAPYDFLQKISLDELLNTSKTFINNMPIDTKLAGYLSASQLIRTQGVSPVVQKYLEQNNPESNFLVQIKKHNLLAKAGSGYESAAGLDEDAIVSFENFRIDDSLLHYYLEEYHQEEEFIEPELAADLDILYKQYGQNSTEISKADNNEVYEKKSEPAFQEKENSQFGLMFNIAKQHGKEQKEIKSKQVIVIEEMSDSEPPQMKR
ncbi:MAG: hypothetical protein HAW67_05395 [Endozoicomonadaceae bacterium]|nr:hypothetical protein [Endozoicomonadaceae bacterium]